MIDQDAELLARIAQGDQTAIRNMVTQKLPRLIALAERMLGSRTEAEEVTQEAFIKIWRQAKNWKSGEAKFDTWLHRVAINLCYDKLRARTNWVEMADDTALEVAANQADDRPNPETQLSQTQQGELVSFALMQLPARQREALIWQYYQSLSNIEAANIMQISVDALESLLARARRNMKVLLQKQLFIRD